MTDILCRWLNDDLSLENAINKDTFAEDLSNGYLLGKLLNKHGLQEDFPYFSKGRTSEAKLGNFMRLESSLRLLDVPFDSNLAHKIMSEQQGAATKLMYQIYVALSRKQAKEISGQTLKSTRPVAKANLDRIQTGLYTQLIKQKTPRQVDLNFQELVEKFHEKQKQREELIAMKEQQEEIKFAEQRKHNCYEAIQKQRIAKAKQAEMYAKLKPIKLPKPSTSSGSNECKMFKDNTGLNKKIAIETMNKIDNFEANLASRKLKSIAGDNETATSSLKSELVQSSKEEAERRKERETRRRKVLMAQIKAIHDQEERNRELMLQDRLTRQCLQEKRIVTQLMQIRKEKDNIRNNRILRLKQFEEERDKEFQRSLDMEASEARRINEEQQVLFKARQEKRQLLLQKKAQENYQKHYNICQNIMSQILDLCIKTVEYRKLTQNLIPAKLMRDWKVLFLTGKPLYEDYIDGCNLDVESSMASGGSTEDKRDSEEVLDDVDIQEYLHMKHEWRPTDPSISPPSPSPILTHIVHRLIDINNPPKTPPEPPNFPKFYLKAAFVGLPFTGKTTILNKLYIKYGIEILTPSELILKAIETYKSEIAPSQTTLPTSDEEDKPMDIDDDTTSIQPNLSSLGTLGELAHNLIVNGEAVDDATLVDIIVHEIKNLPDGNGWILDNFPITLEQAQLLSIGLTGQTPSAMKEHSDNAQLRSHHFILISEREVNEEELLNLNAVCGLDLVLHFHAAHESVFQRSVLTNEDAIGKPDIQQSLLAFDTHWPKLRKWYQNYRTLQIVNANKELENLYVEVLDIIETKLSKSKQVETMKKFGLKVNNELLNSKSMTRMNMASVSSPTKIELNEASLSKLRPRKVRRPSSAGNTKPKSKSTKKQESKATAVNAGVLVSVESELFDLFDVNAEPGQEGWIYSSLPVNPLLAPSLAQRWPEAEKLYMLAFKETFCSLRQERDTMCHYIFNKRNEFCHYLKRADNKQKFISQWQASYNTITLELRQSDLMKCEFHRQVDDLCDKLWSICDEHKFESENERQTIIDDQWLPDHIGVISNHYISLMQAELARFQDAILLLKDYYTSMSNAMPQEIPDMSNRLPLIELPLHCPRHDSASPSSSKDNENEPVKEEEQVESKENETENEEENCIPLMARQTPSVPETTSTDDNTNIKAKKKNTTEQEISLPCPPPEDLTNLDLDDQLIVHNYNTAIAISYKLLNNEIHLIEEATAEANKPPVIAAPVQEEKSPGKKGKKSPVGKKGKSPTGKGKKAAPEPEKAEPSIPVIAPSPEELAQKQKMELMRKEHTAALKHEEMTLNVRLTLIKNKALEFINYFKNKVNEMYVEMEQWIDKRYQQEIQSINQLSEVLRCAIEQEIKLLHELTLCGPDFMINQGVSTYYPSPPISPVPPREPLNHNYFTINQLLSLIGHIRLSTSNTFMTTESLFSLLQSLISKSMEQNVFPSAWKGLTHEQVHALIESIYGKTINLIDWRQLILSLAQPYPIPTTSDLLSAYHDYQMMTHDDSKTIIGMDSYMKIQLWLDNDCNGHEDRNKRIKTLLFELYKDVSSNTVDYQEMLLYLSASPNIRDGFMKALSIMTDRTLTSDDDCDVSIETLDKVITHGLVTDRLHNLEGIYSHIAQQDGVTSLPLNVLYNPILKLIDACYQYHLLDPSMLVVSHPLATEPHPPTD